MPSMDNRHEQERELEAVIDEFAESVPVGLIRTDAAGRCISVNRRWCVLTQLTREEALGDGWLKALHPEDRERAIRQWTKTASDNTEYVDEFRFQSGSSEVRILSTRFLPILHDAKLSGYVGAITDITERQETVETLSRLAQNLGERVKELDCLFGISDIVENSSGSLKQIVRETTNILPRSWSHPEIACARIVLTGLKSQTDNFRISPWRQSVDIFVHGKLAGSVEVCYLQQMPERDEGPFLAEERRLLHGVAQRLGRTAERIRAETLLREKEAELRSRLTHLTRVSVMGEMASSIAHEINQPLTAIAAYAQACKRLIEDDASNESLVADVLQRVCDEALRAGDIVHRLKNFAQRRESQRTLCDINSLIKDVQRLVAPDARLHEVQLVFELADALPPVLVDSVQIQQVVLNLIRNGIDALENTKPESRQIIIRSEFSGDANVRVSVTDNGCGLPKNAERDLFQSFFTTKTDGMGMGLSVSRSIVTAHGGGMWFSRNPNGGTTFYFTVPTETEHAHRAG